MVSHHLWRLWWQCGDPACKSGSCDHLNFWSCVCFTAGAVLDLLYLCSSSTTSSALMYPGREAMRPPDGEKSFAELYHLPKALARARGWTARQFCPAQHCESLQNFQKGCAGQQLKAYMPALSCKCLYLRRTKLSQNSFATPEVRSLQFWSSSLHSRVSCHAESAISVIPHPLSLSKTWSAIAVFLRWTPLENYTILKPERLLQGNLCMKSIYMTSRRRTPLWRKHDWSQQWLLGQVERSTKTENCAYRTRQTLLRAEVRSQGSKPSVNDFRLESEYIWIRGLHLEIDSSWPNEATSISQKNSQKLPSQYKLWICCAGDQSTNVQ